MELNLKGKTVLVTGASKGIGLAIARGFAAEGCDVHLAARSKDSLEKDAADIRKDFSVQAWAHPHDLSIKAERTKLVEECGDVDILVNNAGAIPFAPIEELSDEEWRAAWDLKVFGYIDNTRNFYAKMKTRKKGVIINIIGVAAERGSYNYIAGSMGNVALMRFTQLIGGRSTDHGVRVMGINPGIILTDRIIPGAKKKAKAEFGDENRYRETWSELPFGRPGEVDEIADVAVFFASDRGSYASGTVVTIDGGVAYRS